MFVEEGLCVLFFVLVFLRPQIRTQNKERVQQLAKEKVMHALCGNKDQVSHF